MGNTIKLSVKRQHKYQTLRVKIVLNSFTLPQFNKFWTTDLEGIPLSFVDQTVIPENSQKKDKQTARITVDKQVKHQSTTAKPDAKTSAKNSHKGKKTSELEATQILTGYEAVDEERERIRDIIVYDIPYTWDLQKILAELKLWGNAIKCSVKRQHKYQTLRVKIALSSFALPQFNNYWFPASWTLRERKQREKFQAVIHDIPEDMTMATLWTDHYPNKQRKENWETTLKALDTPQFFIPDGKELKWCRHSIPNLKKAQLKPKAKNTLNTKRSGKSDKILDSNQPKKKDNTKSSKKVSKNNNQEEKYLNTQKKAKKSSKKKAEYLEISKQSKQQKASTKIRRPKTSWVWQFFELNKDNTKAVCQISGCEKMLTWCGSPSSLATHLSGAHGITKEIAMKHDEEELKNPPKSSIKPYKHSKQESLTQNVIGFVIGTVQPLNVVEDPDFIKMINGFDKRYKVPCTKTIKNRISKTFEIGKVTLKNQLVQVKHISLTLDAWSLPAHLPYLGVTAHWITSDFELNEVLLSMEELPYPHDATEIQKHLIDLFYEWEIESKIIALVTDNGSNVKKACNEIGVGERIPCAAHTLQLSIGKGLDKIRQLVDKSIAMLKASLISNVSLNIHKEGEKLEELYPTVHEWKVIKEIVELLNPFEAATCLLSDVKYLTIGFTYSCICNLRERLEIDFTSLKTSDTKYCKNAILEDLTSRWNISQKLCLKGSFFDPRFKSLDFINSQEECDDIFSQLREEFMIFKQNEQIDISTTSADKDTDDLMTEMSSFWKKKNAKAAPIKDEFQHYFDLVEWPVLKEYDPYL
ncbi:unnamed protein product [Rhizophagus irregularis]|nr:unnamed protein product [Rhizophagus irregularis]